MARDLTTATKNAAIADRVQPVFFFYADYSTGAVRVWSGFGDLSWDSQTWSGIGDFGGVQEIAESSEIRANGVSFTLNGIPSAQVSLALTDDYQGRTCTLWLGLLDTSDGSLIADPVVIFSGRMDVMTINDGVDTASISLQAENLLIDLNRPRERRYTHEDQLIDYASDEGLEYVAGLQEKPITWGPSSGAPASSSSGGSSANRNIN